MVVTHSVVDVNNWLKGKAERADSAIEKLGHNDKSGGCGHRGTHLPEHRSSMQPSIRADLRIVRSCSGRLLDE